jgi:hypothetical protein
MFYTVCGWIGMLLLLLGYYLIASKKVTGKSPAYHWINLGGAVGLILDSYQASVWSVVILNIFWGSIAIKSLLSLVRKPLKL